MEHKEKIRYRQTEIQRAWDSVIDEIYWTEKYIEIKRDELRSLEEKLQKAESIKFQIFKKAQKLNCQDIL